MRNIKLSFSILMMSIFYFCNQCVSSPQVGERFCLNGNCQDGFGHQRIEFIAPRNQEIDNGFVTYAEYRGEFQNGMRSGIGKFEKMLSSIDGEKYEGEFQNDLFHGKGKWEKLLTSPWPKEEIASCPWKYEGEFENGVPHGDGQLTTRLGKTISGTFRNGWICTEGNCDDGNGTMLYWSGTYYQGSLQQWSPKGKVKSYSTVKNESYNGEMHNWEYNGYGVETTYSMPEYKDGKWNELEPTMVYEGEFKSGKYDGYGKLTFLRGGPNGTIRIQEGEWDGYYRCKGPKCNGALRPLSDDFTEKLRERAETKK
ncbi:hypothetical protein EHQ92_01680 [Leptospira biflexa]|uniref:hypothetical protein n=1 Tax=Leptospira biflexa TaxID=172 RepID=UPI0010912F24|nr:hypothetical protein [Leptospira biflexa]TGM46659.1 hypothetical protein EHQ92_01680 [Leptospira biflexa]TGM50877.1 hypothetical protein EHQ88_11405 [Leptospira biflexa]